MSEETTLRGGLRRLAPRSLRAQIVVSTVGLMAAVLLVVGVAVQVLLAFTADRDIDRVLEDRADAVIVVVDAATPPGSHEVVAPAADVDPGVRVYDARGRLVAGSIESEVRAAADDLARVTTARNEDPDETIRLRAVPFRTGSGARGVVVVSQHTAPYERSERYALLVTVLVGLFVVGLSAAIALRVTRQALAPVSRMAQRAEDWSEHDLAHRFDLDDTGSELGRLGATLDHLLDRVAMAIRSEQRLTAELAHELRTPLTAIQGAAGLALMRGVSDDAVRVELEEVAASARRMGEVITTLLETARDQGTAAATSSCQVADLVGDLRAAVPQGIAFVDATHGSSARVAGPRDVVLRAVAPLLENAVGHARTTVWLSVTDSAAGIAITVRDDGPGIAAEVRDHLFDAGASASGGTGLGLGIARRVARSLGGEVTADDRPDGAVFVVTLPRA